MKEEKGNTRLEGLRRALEVNIMEEVKNRDVRERSGNGTNILSGGEQGQRVEWT